MFLAMKDNQGFFLGGLGCEWVGILGEFSCLN